MVRRSEANTGECAGFRVSAGDAQSVAVGAAVGEQLCQRLAVCESAVAAQAGQQTGDGVVTALWCGGMGCNALVGEFVLAPGNLTALFFRAAERRREADRKPPLTDGTLSGNWRKSAANRGSGCISIIHCSTGRAKITIRWALRGRVPGVRLTGIGTITSVS